jgi:hypothetical protein
MDMWTRNCIGMVVDGIDGTHADCGSGGLDGPTGGYVTLGSMGPTDVPTADESGEGLRYFQVRPEDESQPALELDVHGHTSSANDFDLRDMIRETEDFVGAEFAMAG